MLTRGATRVAGGLRDLSGVTGAACSVLVAIGLPEPQRHKAFDGLSPKHGFWTSKDFLPQVAKASKPGMCSSACKRPQNGHSSILIVEGSCRSCTCCARLLDAHSRRGHRGH